MLQARSNLSKITLNVGGYTKTLDKTFGEIWREACRVWLRTVLAFHQSSGDNFPVYTGMAKATLGPLARRLGGVSFSVSPRAIRKGKSPAAGARASKFRIKDRNPAGAQRFTYMFHWSTSVLHFWINENFPVPLPLKHDTPWEIILEANDAMDAYVRDAVKRRLHPKVKDYIQVTKRIS